MGYHEPLNPAEQIKKEDDGLNVRERIERIFAPGGFRSIGKQDLRSRMRWWGLYTQRTQGVPGERTGSAEPEELEDEFFMMRIRIDGGRDDLRPAPGDRVGERALRPRRRRRDRPPERAAALDPHRGRASRSGSASKSVGLSTQEACGDTPRVILGCPLAGVTADEVFDATPDDPRRSRSGSSATRRSRTCRASTRPRSAGAPPDARTPRSTTSRSWAWPDPAASSGTTCRSGAASRRTRCSRSGSARSSTRERVPEVWAGVTALFREYGYRRSRNHARLKFLVKDWGAERVREVLEREFLGPGRCPTDPRPARRRWRRATTSG